MRNRDPRPNIAALMAALIIATAAAVGPAGLHIARTVTQGDRQP